MTSHVPDEHAEEMSDETAGAPPQEGSEGVPADQGKLRGRRLPGKAAGLALVLALLAAAASGVAWWQYHELSAALDAAGGAADVSLREVRADLRDLEDRITGLGEAGQDTGRVLEQLVERVDGFPARFSDLEERLAIAQGVSADARRRWLRAQAEYFLSVANTELTLRGDRRNAIAALELADQALLDTGSPAFAGVRDRIAGELLELRAVRVPDVEGLSYSLNRLAARVAGLPMRISATERNAAAQRAAEGQPGLRRLWLTFRNALAGMVRIERRENAEVYTLSRDQQALVRRQLEVELTLARLALVQAMPELFAASLASAKALLEEHFDVDEPAAEGAVALLDEMVALDIAPRYPDISGSLALLRNLPDRAG